MLKPSLATYLLLSVITDVERQDEGVSAGKWVPWLLSPYQTVQTLFLHTDANESRTGVGGSLVSHAPFLYSPYPWALVRHFPGQDPSTQNAPDYIGVSESSFFKASLW